MECSTCRSLFSESFDGRMPEPVASVFGGHLSSCATCGAEYTLYRDVFAAVLTLPADETAPAFRKPAEAPGERAALRFRQSPRMATFVRVAASILVLVTSNVLVFRWSRDLGSSEQTPAFKPGIASIASAPLPSSLRDHVEGADLFVRTAAYMPDDVGARGHEILKADFDQLDLPRMSRELRDSGVESSKEFGSEISSYLRASDEFCEQFRRVISAPPTNDSFRAARALAKNCQILRAIDPLRPVIAPLAAGAAYRGRLVLTGNVSSLNKLRPEEREFLGAKQARLSGDFQRAVVGFQYFDQKNKFANARLAPVARYLLADTFMQCGRVCEGMGTLARFTGDENVPLISFDPLAKLALFADALDQLSSISLKEQMPGTTHSQIKISFLMPTSPMKTLFPGLRPAVVPENAREFCRQRQIEAQLFAVQDLYDTRLIFKLSRLPEGEVLHPLRNSDLYNAFYRLLLDPTLKPEAFLPCAPPEDR